MPARPGWTTSATTADTGPTVQVMHEAAERDQRELRAERRAVAAKAGARIASATTHSAAIVYSLLRGRRAPGAIDDGAPDDAAGGAAQDDERGLYAGLVGRDAVDAVEEARQPRPYRRDDDQLRGAAEAHPEQRGRARQRLDDVAPPCPPSSSVACASTGVQLDRLVVAHVQVSEREDEARARRRRRTPPASPSARRSRRRAPRRAPSRPRPRRRTRASRRARRRAGKRLAISAAPTEP